MSRTGPLSPRRDRRGARRRGALSLLLSFGIHLGLALILTIPGLVCSPERERIGSDEIDVDLVQPRLAPPLETWGQLGDRPGRPSAAVRASQGRRRGQAQARTEPSREARGRRVPERSPESWTVPAPQASARPSRAEQVAKAARELEEREAKERQRVEQERKRSLQAKAAVAGKAPRTPDQAQRQRLAEAARPQRRSRLLVGVTPRLAGEAGEAAAPEERSRPSRAPADDAPRLAQLPRDERSDSPLFRLTLPSERQSAAEAMPDGPAPSAVLDAVQREVAQREHRRQSALAASRARFAAAEQQLAQLTRQTGRTARCSAGTYEGSAAGLGGRDAQGSQEQLGGKAPRWGLKFYLSGRRVRNSRVVRPPEPLNMPSVRCKVTQLSITPATVRMLIETNGKVGHLYLKHSSGSPRFDRCAMSHARKMRFRPGTDEAGVPLNVWINLRVEPGLLTTAGL